MKGLKFKDFQTAAQSLGRWFERTSRVLPWRETPTAYRVWISEIMLQQTQVVTVVPYFERFVARFPTVESLAGASEDDVLLHWAGLGYYSRARNIHAAAKRVVAAGAFPTTREGWLELPGVGPYTAGAISSIAYDQVEPILDGNVERVISRVKMLDRSRGDTAYKAHLWKLSNLSVQLAAEVDVRPRVFNQALMELGAVVCTPKNPKCGICPIVELCRAHALGTIPNFPPPKAPKKWVEVQEKMIALIDEPGGRVLLRKRAAGEWRAGLWDFPTLGEIPGAIKLGKVTEELGEIESRHVVTRHKISRTTSVVKLTAKNRENGLPDEFAWVSIRLPEVALGSAPRKVLQLMSERWASLSQFKA